MIKYTFYERPDQTHYSQHIYFDFDINKWVMEFSPMMEKNWKNYIEKKRQDKIKQVDETRLENSQQ